jgi:hypothetical protein
MASSTCGVFPLTPTPPITWPRDMLLLTFA